MIIVATLNCKHLFFFDFGGQGSLLDSAPYSCKKASKGSGMGTSTSFEGVKNLTAGVLESSFDMASNVGHLSNPAI